MWSCGAPAHTYILRSHWSEVSTRSVSNCVAADIAQLRLMMKILHAWIYQNPRIDDSIVSVRLCSMFTISSTTVSLTHQAGLPPEPCFKSQTFLEQCLHLCLLSVQVLFNDIESVMVLTLIIFFEVASPDVF